MKLVEDFRDSLQGYDLTAIEQSDDVTFVVDADFRLTAYNPAYASFGRANGLRELEGRFGLCCSVLQAISGPVKQIYHKLWTRILESGEVVSRDYYCSSALEFRLFRQTAYPLRNRAGLIISNHLVIETPINQREGFIPVKLTTEHTTRSGIVIQCSNCRKIKNQRAENRWDWIVEAVVKSSANVSHSICPLCLEHYYPDE